MNAGQDDLLRAAVECRGYIPQHFIQPAAAPCPARNARDAESTVVIAAILHLDEGARAQVRAR